MTGSQAEKEAGMNAENRAYNEKPAAGDGRLEKTLCTGVLTERRLRRYSASVTLPK